MVALLTTRGSSTLSLSLFKLFFQSGVPVFLESSVVKRFERVTRVIAVRWCCVCSSVFTCSSASASSLLTPLLVSPKNVTSFSFRVSFLFDVYCFSFVYFKCSTRLYMLWCVRIILEFYCCILRKYFPLKVIILLVSHAAVRGRLVSVQVLQLSARTR